MQNIIRNSRSVKGVGNEKQTSTTQAAWWKPPLEPKSTGSKGDPLHFPKQTTSAVKLRRKWSFLD